MAPGGPLLDLFVGVSEPKTLALKAANLSVPSFLKLRALIDTGASCTCVEPACLAKLGLTPTGSCNIHTPSTGGTPEPCEQYDVQVILLHPNGQQLRIAVLPIIAAKDQSLSVQGVQVLIGRDVLSRCLLVYDGAMNIFSIAF